jgi:hypothetical protein
MRWKRPPGLGCSGAGRGRRVVADEHGGEEGNERLVRLVARHGVACIDAPVLGTKQPAEHCQLVVLASGPEGVRERCEPVFGAVGSKTVWLAEAGEGSRLKLVLNNWIVGPPGCSQRPSRSPGDGGGPTEVPGHCRGRTAQATLRAGKGENDGLGGLPDEPLRGARAQRRRARPRGRRGARPAHEVHRDRGGPL